MSNSCLQGRYPSESKLSGQPHPHQPPKHLFHSHFSSARPTQDVQLARVSGDRSLLPILAAANLKSLKRVRTKKKKKKIPKALEILATYNRGALDLVSNLVSGIGVALLPSATAPVSVRISPTRQLSASLCTSIPLNACP